MASVTAQARINQAVWRRGEFVAKYAHRRLSAAEVMLLVRYQQQLSGRVIEIGCGAGRILGYLIELGGEVHGIDVSEAMVEYCRIHYPEADVAVTDVEELAATSPLTFTAVLAMDNVLDVFGDAERRGVIGDLRRLVEPDGIFVFTSHNRQSIGSSPVQSSSGAGLSTRQLLERTAERSLAEVARAAIRLPRRIRNRRRLAGLQHEEHDHAILNDAAHDYGLLHYYIRAEDQQRQLQDLGFTLLACLDPDGATVEPALGSEAPWLLYVCRPQG